MGDSGIETDLSSYLASQEMDNDDNYYKLQSRAIVGSPKVDIKNTHALLRVNLKQQLQKQQIEEEKKRDQSLSQSYKPPQSKPQVIQMPNSSSIPIVEIAPQLPQVKTQLQNPTKFHVKESQRQQIHMFLANPHGKVSAQSLPVQTNNPEPQQQLSGSAPVDQDVSFSADLSSSAMSSELGVDMDNILSDILSLQTVDPSMDSDLSLIEPSLNQMSSTMPHANLFDIYETPSEPLNNASTSCPAKFAQATPPQFMTEEEARLWQKDRQKKDNHNQIERRRRFNINDRIKELGTLLPRNIDPDMRQNKGSILRSSVDYIRKLKRDQERLKMVEERQKQMEAMNRKLLLKMQQMEMIMNASGLSTNLVKDDIEQVANLSFQQSFQIPQPSDQESNSATAIVMSQSQSSFEDFMDDSSPVSGDPMLSSNPVSPNTVSDASDLFNC